MKKREKVKQAWFKVPRTVRRPFVLIIGTAMCIIAPTIGWLPGPGGIPLFLLGIAVLSTEFEWAERLRDHIFDQLKIFKAWVKRHPGRGWTTIVLLTLFFIGLGYLLYTAISKIRP